MKEITPGLPVKVVVDVLRQASKVNSVYLYYEILSSYHWVYLQNVSTEQQSVASSKEIH